MKDHSKPNLLITATVWWPLSARLASRLLAYGCDVSALCPPGHPLRYLPGIRQCHAYSTRRTQTSLAHAIRVAEPDVVVPADDLAVQEFQQLALNDQGVRSIYERSLGSLDSGVALSGRGFLSTLASKLGIAAAESVPVHSIDETLALLQQWGYPAVLKKDGTWGGNGVAILPNQSALDAAFANFLKPVGMAARWKRRVVNGDRLAFANSDRHSHGLTLQRHVEGFPANAMFACYNGVLLADYQVRVCASQGATGAALLVEQIDDPRIRTAGAQLAAELGLSGFFGLDFILARNSEPVLIELNPRTTQLGHLPLRDGTDLAGHMLAAWTGQPAPRSTPHPGTSRTAFFPQAMQGTVQPRLLVDAYVDMPQESTLTAELNNTCWPERQWVARVYHAFRQPVSPGCYVHPHPSDSAPAQAATGERPFGDDYTAPAPKNQSLVPVN